MSIDYYHDTVTLLSSFVLPEVELLSTPMHYNYNGIQPLEMIKELQLDFVRGNIIKYLSRYRWKNGLEDLKKMQYYSRYLVDNFDEFKRPNIKNTFNIEKYCEDKLFTKLETGFVKLICDSSKNIKDNNQLGTIIWASNLIVNSH